MFDSSRPPLLVQPIVTRNLTLFPTHEGYNLHPIENDMILISYKHGWTFPLSVQMQALISKEPLLLVRDKGGITSGGSYTEKGYAHQFCREDGRAPSIHMRLNLFPERPSEEWMLIQNSITIIWVQYNSTTQYLGDEGHDMEHNYNGKLIIRDFVIKKAFAPRIDKASDIDTKREKQYRVESKTIFDHSWELKDEDPALYLEKTLAANDLERYNPSVATALKRAIR